MSKKLAYLIVTLVFMVSATCISWAADPIKVGAPLCLTGPYAGDGLGYWRGIKMAVDELNDSGGVLGRQLEIIKFDTQDFAPELVMQAADRLVGRDKVDVIHAAWAGWGQDVRAYGKYDVPTFVWDASINSVSVFRENPTKYRNWFQLNGIEIEFGRRTFEVMVDLPFKYPNKKIAIISTDDSWGMEVAAGIKKVAKDMGWKVAMEEVVPYGTREWGPILSKIQAIKPALIHLEIVSSPDLITFFKQFAKNPTNSLINFGYGMTLPDFLPNIGEDGDGLMGATNVVPEPPPTPESGAWVDKFKSLYNSEPAAGSFVVYTGVKMWAAAVETVGKADDYDAIIKHLETTKYKTLVGNEILFNKDHYIPYNIWPNTHLQVQGGKFVSLFVGPGNPHADNKFITPPWIK